MLSGPSWVSLYPTSTDPADLAEPFRTSCRRFLDALHAAGATVAIAATLRRPERAYLMHWAWAIAREGFNPRDVPWNPLVDIEWDRPEIRGQVLAEWLAKQAAEAMVQGYAIVFKPALTSRHIEGKAIDMDIAWHGSELVIPSGKNGVIFRIGEPRTGANTALHAIGASYGVYKLVSDPPHWSADGH